MSAADGFRKALYGARAIAGTLGLRPYTVSVSVRSWSGDVVGEGIASVSTTAITESAGQPPKVRWLSGEDIALGGFASGSVEVGPITPSFPGGGTAIATITGNGATTGQLMHFTLTGPEFPNGARYSLKDISSDRALHYMLTLEPITEQ